MLQYMLDMGKRPKNWHHAPEHRLDGRGAYMVTCGTLHKVPILTSPERLNTFQSLLFELAEKYGWRLQAWAVMSNHYHWIGLWPEGAEDAQSLRTLTSRLHEISTKRLNRKDDSPGRKVWHNYWDAQITFEASYFARLKYVHDNPAHHGVVLRSADYPWCSRAWLERTAKRAFVKQLDGFKTDQLVLLDDF